MRALIGHTGFIGGNLLAHCRFDSCYNSKNIDGIRGRSFDSLVCAGAPAAKWKANQEPEADRACLARLMAALAEVKAREVVLISTVDVYGRPDGQDERMPPTGATPYGLHRLELEHFVASRFSTCVVRLPAMFGPGLKKNAVYDLLHDNHVDRIDHRAFQFYDVRRLWLDIQIAQRAGLGLVHFATEPVTMAEVARTAFGMELRNELPGPPARYDFRTRHAALYGGPGGYILDRAEVLSRLTDFVVAEKSEP